MMSDIRALRSPPPRGAGGAPPGLGPRGDRFRRPPETVSTSGGRPPGAHEVGVHVRYGEFFTFLGPPKSGKSDVLRAIAGFLPMTSGRVLVDGQDVSLLPPRGRGVGYVFQEGALWPHLTVAQHIAFGLEQQGLAAAEIARKVGTVAGRLGLAGPEARRPPELGTEQRRRLPS